MIVIMQKCIKNLDDYFDRIIEQQPEKSSVVFQAKTTFAGFTIDVSKLIKRFASTKTIFFKFFV